MTLIGVTFPAAHLLPDAPFIGPWQLTPVALLVGVAGAGYVAGMARVQRRGRRWPRRRALSLLSGLVLVVLATQSGIAAYEEVSFSADVVQHLLLGMAAPALLALSAPVTLALQASSVSVRTRLLSVLHSAPAHFLSHPILAWGLFVASLFVLYLSPLYRLSLRNPLVHQLLHAHFFLSGLLFFWLVMARDPARRTLTAAVRLAMVVTTIPFHALLGTAILARSRPLGLMTGADGLADQRLGATILWAGGDVVIIVAGLAVAMQWIRQDERAAAREDLALAQAANDKA